VRPIRRKELPRPIRIGPDANEAEDGSTAIFLPAPFRFCLHCGVSYGFRRIPISASWRLSARKGGARRPRFSRSRSSGS